MKKNSVLCAALLLGCVCAGEAKENLKMTVDFSVPAGPVKALHGVNNSPATLGKPIDTFKKAGIPYVRLHDAMGAFGGAYYVDVPNIFRNFDADPDDPASYEFALTDAYIKGLVASGCKIFYRLGVTIEHTNSIKVYRTDPPKDFKKWAKVCENIIRHYNEGWANGFHYNIEYWEIWNEPENIPMWTGTKEQFFEFYRTAATYLKNKFPHLKFGGYASCGFYSTTRKGTSARYRNFVVWFNDFMKYISAEETAAPLDFFSWHLYTFSPKEISRHADYVREKLDAAGFTKAESIFNEWHCTPQKPIYEENRFVDIKEEPGAAGTVAAFIHMQYGAVDKAMYYDAYPQRAYCGLFYFPTRKVTKNYYSFLAFNVLYNLGTACKVTFANDNVVIGAAKNDKSAAILVSNYTADPCNVELDIKGRDFSKRQIFVIDKEHKFESAASCFDGKILKMAPYSVVLLATEDIVIDTPEDRKPQQQNLNGIVDRPAAKRK